MIVGRERELRLLEKALKPAACVALVGASGVGKSELARAATRKRRAVWVDCFGMTGDEIAFRIASAAGEDPETALADLLADVDVLVLDDWTEEVSLDEVRQAFEGAVLLSALVAPPNITTLPVHPFEVPDLEHLATSDAFQLFEAQADDVRLGASDEFAPEAVREIIHGVGGHPLGVTLAARHAAIVGAVEVARLMRDGVELRDDQRAPRQRSLSLALDFSWKQLAPRNQALLYLASRFDRPVRVITLAEVAGLELAEAMEAVRELTQCGALVPGAFPRAVSVWRDIGLCRLGESAPEQVAAFEEKMFELGHRLAREAHERTESGPIDDAPSIWEAALRDYEHQDREKVGEIVAELLVWSHRFAARRFASSNYLEEIALWSRNADAMLTRLSFLRGDPDRHIESIEAALEVVESDAGRAKLHFELAMSASIKADIDKALEHLANARNLGGTYAGICLETMLLMSTEQMGEARGVMDQLLQMEPPSAGHRVIVSFLQTWLLPPEERLTHARAVVAGVEDDNPRVQILALRSLADVLDLRGRYSEARAQRERVLELATSIDHVRFIENVGCELAWGSFCEGDVSAARLVDRVDLTQTMAEVKLRRDCVVAMLACMDGNPSDARVVAESIKRHMPHVPSLGGVFEVIDGAIALTLGENWSGSQTTALMAQALEARDRSHRDQIKIYNDLAALRGSYDWSARFATHWIMAQGPPFFRRLHALEAEPARLVALSDCSAFRVDGVWNYLPETSAAMLSVLIHGETASFEALKEAAWPDEVVAWDSLVNRVNVRISQLRGAGLKPVLQKTAEGFVLDCSTFLEPAA